MLVEQAADGIVLLDRKLNIVDVNKAACEMTGFTCEELLKQNAKDLYPPGELEERPLRLDEVLSGETVITERRATKKDGSLIEVEISAKLIEGDQTKRLSGISQDERSKKKRAALSPTSSHYLQRSHQGRNISIPSWSCFIPGPAAAVPVSGSRTGSAICPMSHTQGSARIYAQGEHDLPRFGYMRMLPRRHR